MSDFEASGSAAKKGGGRGLLINLALVAIVIGLLGMAVSMGKKGWAPQTPIPELTRTMQRLAPLDPALASMAEKARLAPERFSAADYANVIRLAAQKCEAMGFAKGTAPPTLKDACFLTLQLQEQQSP